jgi:hypothetical protein
MNAILLALLDPKALAVILTAFGSAIGWLVTQVRKNRADAQANRAAHQECEVRLARAEECSKADRAEIRRLSGSVSTLTALLKKEIHLG